jgi:hypothetical protein
MGGGGAGLGPGGGSRGASFGGLGMRANVQPFRLSAIKISPLEVESATIAGRVTSAKWFRWVLVEASDDSVKLLMLTRRLISPASSSRASAPAACACGR